ncbi:MAG: hypothetical protein EOO75_03555 [Myxococcales bacterium]|nr:MAG: hypothetical protein EOO75_03555 [Myxococcales bacterium]
MEVAHPLWTLRHRPDSHAVTRLEPMTRLIEDELTRLRAASGLGPDEGKGIVVYLHEREEKGGPTRKRAFASWRDDGEVSAHFLVVADFDDRTELLRSLVANELVKASTFAALRRTPDDHMTAPNSALAWLMEGSGTLLHTGGWFGRDVDALTTAFIDGKIDHPVTDILSSDYQKSWTFNPRITHTFNVVEFPELASFTRHLWSTREPARYTALLRRVRELGDAGALRAFDEVYGAPLPALEAEWRKQLASGSKRDPAIDAPRLGRVVRRYVAVLEVSARALTLDNAAVASWSKKYAADISVMPLLKLDLDTAEANLSRAHDGLLADLTRAAPLVEKGLGVRLQLPVKAGAKRELVAGPVVVSSVSPGGAGARRALAKGDELHLLDSEIHATLGEPTPGAYEGVVRVTREGKLVTLAPAR